MHAHMHAHNSHKRPAYTYDKRHAYTLHRINACVVPRGATAGLEGGRERGREGDQGFGGGLGHGVQELAKVLFDIPTRLNQLNIAAVQHLPAVPLAPPLDARRDVVVLSAHKHPTHLLPLEQIRENKKDKII
jgi:hypothetical protein